MNESSGFIQSKKYTYLQPGEEYPSISIAISWAPVI